MVLVIGLLGCGRRQESGPRAIVSNELDGTVSVIDLTTRRTLATIPVGKRPRGLKASRDGTTLYVALSGSPRAGPGVDAATLPPADRSADGIGVIDLRQLALVRTIPSGQDPESFDLVADAQGDAVFEDALLVVSNEETAEASIVDLRRGEIRARIAVGGEPEGVTTAPDGLVWVTSEEDHQVSAIDPVRGVVVATIATGRRPRWIAFTPDGPAGALGLVTGENDRSVTLFDPRAHRALGRIELPRAAPRDGSIAREPRPMGIAVSRDGREAYVATGRGGSVAVIDLASRTVTRVIEDIGARPWGIAVGPDGRLYTANGPSNDVAVIDPVAGRVVHRLAAGSSPWGVVVVP